VTDDGMPALSDGHSFDITITVGDTGLPEITVVGKRGGGSTDWLLLLVLGWISLAGRLTAPKQNRLKNLLTNQ